MTGPLVNRFKILIGSQWALFVASVVYDPLQTLVNFDSCTRVLWENPRGHM